jgi:oligopeptide/dipeptide ABC transporter ATP-binding protein
MYAGRIVEAGPAATIFQAPMHPYTRALIDCVPHLEGAPRLGAITGTMPGLRALPSGCRFHPRCPFAEPRCPREEPRLRPVSDGHEAACHLVEPASDGLARAAAFERPGG